MRPKPTTVIAFIAVLLTFLSTVQSQITTDAGVYKYSRSIELATGTPYAIKLKDQSIIIFVLTPDPLFSWRACSVLGWKIDSIQVYEEMKTSNAFPIGPLKGYAQEKAKFESKTFTTEDVYIRCKFAEVDMELLLTNNTACKVRIDQEKVDFIAETHYDGAFLAIDSWNSLRSIKSNWRKNKSDSKESE